MALTAAGGQGVNAVEPESKESRVTLSLAPSSSAAIRMMVWVTSSVASEFNYDCPLVKANKAIRQTARVEVDRSPSLWARTSSSKTRKAFHDNGNCVVSKLSPDMSAIWTWRVACSLKYPIFRQQIHSILMASIILRKFCLWPPVWERTEHAWPCVCTTVMRQHFMAGEHVNAQLGPRREEKRVHIQWQEAPPLNPTPERICQLPTVQQDVDQFFYTLVFRDIPDPKHWQKQNSFQLTRTRSICWRILFFLFPSSQSRSSKFLFSCGLSWYPIDTILGKLGLIITPVRFLQHRNSSFLGGQKMLLCFLWAHYSNSKT